MTRDSRTNLIMRWAFVIATALVLAGCGGDDEPADDAPNDPGYRQGDDVRSPSGAGTTAIAPGDTQTAGAVDRALALYRQGDKDRAVETFVGLDFANITLFDASSLLSLTERQFQLLGAEKRQAASEQIMASIGDIRGLCLEVVSRSQSPGNEAYLDAVSQFADRVLSKGGSLAILQNVAKALKQKVAQTTGQ